MNFRGRSRRGLLSFDHRRRQRHRRFGEDLLRDQVPSALIQISFDNPLVLKSRRRSNGRQKLPLKRLVAIAARRHEEHFDRSALMAYGSFEGITIQDGKSVVVALDAQDNVAPRNAATFGKRAQLTGQTR